MEERQAERFGQDEQAAESGQPAKETGLAQSLSLREARTLLMEKHGIALDEHDPILMAVTLHEAFLKDYTAMLEQHNSALTQIMGRALAELQATLGTETTRLLAEARGVLTDDAPARDRGPNANPPHPAIRQLIYCILFLTGLLGLLAGVALWRLWGAA